MIKRFRKRYSRVVCPNEAAIEDLRVLHGMLIPMVMLNDEITASNAHQEYLTMYKGEKPTKCNGKGLVTKKEGVEDDVDSKETKEEDEIPLVQRQTKVFIGRQVHQESDKEDLDHSKKLKRVERMSEIEEFLLQLKKARKKCKQDFIVQQPPRGSNEGSGVTPEVLDGLNLKGSNEGSGVNLAVLDEPSGSSSSSSSDSDDEVEDISSEDDDKATKEKVDDAQDKDEQAIIEQPENFINDNPDVSLTDVLKEPMEHEVQSMMEVPVTQENPSEQRPPLVDTMKVDAMSRFNLHEAIDKSVQAHLKNILPKDVPNFGKIKLPKAAKKSMPKYAATPFDQASLDEYDQTDGTRMLNSKEKSKSYNKHPAHRALYDALMQ
ncbi:hypothetical protein Tco_1079889 [Tanacetum coccineum]|uniref:Uncharacterized protein n=1 Tax=Tanacetum coccineum TaxID=301880 RepID=A0ABQ5HTC2_9ASTR